MPGVCHALTGVVSLAGATALRLALSGDECRRGGDTRRQCLHRASAHRRRNIEGFRRCRFIGAAFAGRRL